MNKIGTAIVREHGWSLKDTERRDISDRITGNCYACSVYNILTQAVAFFH